MKNAEVSFHCPICHPCLFFPHFMKFFDLISQAEHLSPSPLRSHLLLLPQLSPPDALQLIQLIRLMPQLSRHPPLMAELQNYEGYLRIVWEQDEEGLKCLKESKRLIILVGNPRTQLCLKVNRHFALCKLKSNISLNQFQQIQNITERLSRQGWPDQLNCVELICNLALARYNYVRSHFRLSELYYRNIAICQVKTTRLEEEKALGLSQLALLLAKMGTSQESTRLCLQIYNKTSCELQLRSTVGQRIRSNVELCLKLNCENRPLSSSIIIKHQTEILEKLKLQIQEFQRNRLDYLFLLRKIDHLSQQNHSEALRLRPRLLANLFHSPVSLNSMRCLLYSAFAQGQIDQRRLLQFQSIIQKHELEDSILQIQKQLLIGQHLSQEDLDQSRIRAAAKLKHLHSQSLEELFPQQLESGWQSNRSAKQTVLEQKEQRIIRRKSAIEARIKGLSQAHQLSLKRKQNFMRTSETITQLDDPGPSPEHPVAEFGFGHIEELGNQLKEFVVEPIANHDAGSAPESKKESEEGCSLI